MLPSGCRQLTGGEKAILSWLVQRGAVDQPPIHNANSHDLAGLAQPHIIFLHWLIETEASDTGARRSLHADCTIDAVLVRDQYTCAGAVKQQIVGSHSVYSLSNQESRIVFRRVNSMMGLGAVMHNDFGTHIKGPQLFKFFNFFQFARLGLT